MCPRRLPGGVAPAPRLIGALLGLAVAFVLVMLLQALSPDPGLNEGEGEVRFERFSFQEEEVEFTEGSRVRLVNAGAVPATFVVTDPAGENVSVRVSAGSATNLTLAIQGTYNVTTVEWPWAEQAWVVRTENPFGRFFEDLF